MARRDDPGHDGGGDHRPRTVNGAITVHADECVEGLVELVRRGSDVLDPRAGGPASPAPSRARRSGTAKRQLVSGDEIVVDGERWSSPPGSGVELGRTAARRRRRRSGRARVERIELRLSVEDDAGQGGGRRDRGGRRRAAAATSCSRPPRCCAMQLVGRLRALRATGAELDLRGRSASAGLLWGDRIALHARPRRPARCRRARRRRRGGQSRSTARRASAATDAERRDRAAGAARRGGQGALPADRVAAAARGGHRDGRRAEEPDLPHLHRAVADDGRRLLRQRASLGPRALRGAGAALSPASSPRRTRRCRPRTSPRPSIASTPRRGLDAAARARRGTRSQLWERRRGDEDFLVLRSRHRRRPVHAAGELPARRQRGAAAWRPTATSTASIASTACRSSSTSRSSASSGSRVRTAAIDRRRARAGRAGRAAAQPGGPADRGRRRPRPRGAWWWMKWLPHVSEAAATLAGAAAGQRRHRGRRAARSRAPGAGGAAGGPPRPARRRRASRTCCCSSTATWSSTGRSRRAFWRPAAETRHLGDLARRGPGGAAASDGRGHER